MKIFRLIVPSLAGLFMAFSALAAFAWSAPTPGNPAPKASETDLLPAGFAGDIHADASGRLWISEIDSNTVREFDPATRAYTLYTGISGGVHDAQLGPDGQVWWLQHSPKAVARMDIGTRVVTTWPVTIHYPGALAFDTSQRAWFVDPVLAGVYRFDASSNQFCDYALPGIGGGPFIVAHNGDLWLSDYVSKTLGRLTPASGAYTYWPLNFGGGFPLPNDGAFDADGNLWWADGGLRMIGRLEVASNRLTLFGPPGLVTPERVLYQGGKVWFTDPNTNTLGYINPATAIGIGQHVATPTTSLITPDCDNVGSGHTFTAGFSTGLSAFSPLVLTGTTSADGALYQVPGGGAPYGLETAGFDVWVTDVGRDKLIHLETALRLDLPLLQR